MPISDIIAAILTVIMLMLQFREWSKAGLITNNK